MPLSLDELESAIRVIMDAAGPELRYLTRQVPVVVLLNYKYDNKFNITNIEIVDKQMVITIDPVF